MFCAIGAVIAIAGAIAVPLLPGEALTGMCVLIAVGVTLASIVFLYGRTLDPIRFRLRSTALGWYLPAVCVNTAIPYFGAFSPAPLVLVLGVYFVGLGRSRGVALATYATCAGAQLVFAAIVITGVVRDPGIIRADTLSIAARCIVQLLVQLVLLGTLITARLSRRTALVAVGELERAVRIAAHREALLLEAREELERALARGRGKFSGQTLAGYQLGELIGRGAMGEVYEATETRSGLRVAIKVLAPASLGNPDHVRRFFRELRTAVGIGSPHIVRVLEVGEQPVPYLVMERLTGQTLAEILRDRRTLDGEEVVAMIAQVGAGVTAAATAGIVHRDLKPANLFFDQGPPQGLGCWKILDFGVARAVDAGETMTGGKIVGTPSYMSPEQASGGAVDPRTDLYALAAIAYRALTGHPPFAGRELADTLYRVVHAAPARPSLLADLPRDVDLVLAIGLAKRPDERFETAADLVGALAGAFDGTLREEIRARGRVLEEAGAWTSRPSTVRLLLG
jgi:serine/threonine-protein kinase